MAAMGREEPSARAASGQNQSFVKIPQATASGWLRTVVSHQHLNQTLHKPVPPRGPCFLDFRPASTGCHAENVAASY